MAASSSRQLTCHWPDLANEHGEPMLWLGSWLVEARGEEGEWFHSGRGPAVTQHSVPKLASGVRIRRWPSEGLAPEYVDLIPVPSGVILVADLSFESPQSFSLLPVEAEPV